MGPFFLSPTLRFVWSGRDEPGADGARLGACQDALSALSAPVGDGVHGCARLLVVRNATGDRCVGATNVVGRGEHTSDGSRSVLLWPRSPSGVGRESRAAVGAEVVECVEHIWDGERSQPQPTTGHLRSWGPDVND